MGEYLAAPALLDEPAVQQSFLSYFNTIVVSPGDGACLSWSVMRALLLMPPCVRREHLSCPAQRFVSEKLDCIRKEEAALRVSRVALLALMPLACSMPSPPIATTTRAHAVWHGGASGLN